MELRYCSQALTNPIEVLIAVRPLTADIIHIEDILLDPDYSFPPTAAAGIRTMLAVPLLRDGNSIGSI